MHHQKHHLYILHHHLNHQIYHLVVHLGLLHHRHLWQLIQMQLSLHHHYLVYYQIH